MSSWNKNKYGAKKVDYKGYTFDSIAECNRYKELELLERAGKIKALDRQVSFLLIPKQEDEYAVKYKADFKYVENGKLVVEEVKSSATAKDKTYVIKRKLFKFYYQDAIFREIIS